jgi:putative ABC transport system ATP-binding protein
VMVTHDVNIARQARRIISLRDGKITSDQAVTPQSAEDVIRGTKHHEAA